MVRIVRFTAVVGDRDGDVEAISLLWIFEVQWLGDLQTAGTVQCVRNHREFIGSELLVSHFVAESIRFQKIRVVYADNQNRCVRYLVTVRFVYLDEPLFLNELRLCD